MKTVDKFYKALLIAGAVISLGALFYMDNWLLKFNCLLYLLLAMILLLMKNGRIRLVLLTVIVLAHMIISYYVYNSMVL